jgi:hypothetical protein
MSDPLMLGSILVAIVNIGLSVVLILLYGRIYAKTKAPFTLGLLSFAVAFLLQNGLVAYSFGTMIALIPDALAPYLLGIGLLEAIGLVAVIWTATR